LAALEPSVLLRALTDSISPINAQANGKDDEANEFLGSLDPLLLEQAKGILGSPLVKAEDVDFPGKSGQPDSKLPLPSADRTQPFNVKVPTMPATDNVSEALGRLLPTSLEKLAAGPLAASNQGPALTLTLEVRQKLFQRVSVGR
jgi:hypothetical protein